MIEDAFVGDNKYVESREIHACHSPDCADFNFVMDCNFLRVLSVSWVGDSLVLLLLRDWNTDSSFFRRDMPFRAVFEGNVPSGSKYVLSGTRYAADRRFIGPFALFAL